MRTSLSDRKTTPSTTSQSSLDSQSHGSTQSNRALRSRPSARLLLRLHEALELQKSGLGKILQDIGGFSHTIRKNKNGDKSCKELYRPTTHQAVVQLDMLRHQHFGLIYRKISKPLFKKTFEAYVLKYTSISYVSIRHERYEMNISDIAPATSVPKNDKLYSSLDTSRFSFA